jgi:hypothetical protein
VRQFSQYSSVHVQFLRQTILFGQSFIIIYIPFLCDITCSKNVVTMLFKGDRDDIGIGLLPC